MLEEVSDYRSNKCRGKTRWRNIMRKGQSLLIFIFVLRINVGMVFTCCDRGTDTAVLYKNMILTSLIAFDTDVRVNILNGFTRIL